MPDKHQNETPQLARAIKRANRETYNKKSRDDYNRNESIFNPQRQKSCTRILNEAARTSGDANYLDVGTGTGNLLRLASDHFQNCYGVDISENLLAQIGEEFQGCHLAASDAEALPFPNDFFNCISCYALLHHLYSHETLFEECFRSLKRGGTLFTDHDPNYFFTRFYRVYYKIRYRNKPGFGTETEELAEYHNTKSSGINAEILKRTLFDIGFREVAVIYRNTDRTEWSGIAAIAAPVLRTFAKFFPAKSLFTHFAILAIK